MTASATLVVLGAICIYLSGFMMYRSMAGEGKPAAAWTKAYSGASSVALCVIVLLLAGLSLVAKGLL